MKIEEAINQKKFKDNWHKATVNLIYTHNWLAGQIKDFLKQYDITQQQFNVLRILRGQFPEPITTSLIRERMLDKMSDASRIVDRLYKKGLVERHICPADKRLVDIVISAEGLELLRQLDKYNAPLSIPEARRGLSEEEAALLSDLLDKMRG
jgi:DNA-binding MarR family transcriptional regulator